jgi:UDP-N-acetylmuramoyl-L-alanyl-D-glutamate--2,6-diaminopimelate ligase
MDREVPVKVLLDALPGARVVGAPPPVIRGLVADSRRVGADYCFVAVPGFKQDARRFVPEAVARGARLVVTEGEPLGAVDVAQVLVPSVRPALARLAAAWYGHPARGLTLVGVTGTNGKTTTSYLVDALLRARGGPTGVIGTIQYRIGDETRPADQTTPDALEIHALLGAMRARGVRGVSMEVSSHALALHRVDGLDFDIAVFTNLTQDHLDFHGTLEEYRKAKRRLFELLAASCKTRRTAVVNADDPAGRSMVDGLDVPVLAFGLNRGADVRAAEHASTLEGIRVTADTPAGRVLVTSPLVGDHNVLNLLGGVAVGLGLGMPLPDIARALGGVAAVPGRFEQVRAGQPFLVIVDYAHTPDALDRVLATARTLTPGRLAVVFGCGGDRDRGKRPLMGGIAARRCDRVWVTSDNPRTERPEAIVEEVLAGVPREAAARVEAEVDRGAAIARALRWARRNDTVVIAGKGHETYQIIGANILPFDDREIARQILSELRS